MNKKNRNWRKVGYALLIAFAIISFWRGVWGLWDVYIYPFNYAISSWISLIIGTLILYLTRNIIKQFV